MLVLSCFLQVSDDVFVSVDAHRAAELLAAKRGITAAVEKILAVHTEKKLLETVFDSDVLEVERLFAS